MTPSLRTGRDLLGVYLNDHLAAATAGVELSRRMAASAGREPMFAGTLKKLAAEIAADRRSLIEIMAVLNIPRRRYKVFAGWAGEKAGRLKLNRRLVTRSPLSSLEEAEILRLGVEGKGAGWRTLRVLAERDARLGTGTLDELIARAARQLSSLALLTSAAGAVVSGRLADKLGRRKVYGYEVLVLAVGAIASACSRR